MTRALKPAHAPDIEHSVPWFWPFAAAVEMAERGARQFQDNLKFIVEAETIAAPPASDWATPNRVLIDLDTMRLRDFSASDTTAWPGRATVLVAGPYAGHSSTIADHARGQSLVEALLTNGLPRVLVTDWKASTLAMKDFDIDKYLAELNVVVDELGSAVHLVGLCQEGWISTMYAACFPSKVRSLVLAGSPIDTDAGDGPIKTMAHRLPLSFYQQMVDAGGGRLLGTPAAEVVTMLAPGGHIGLFMDSNTLADTWPVIARWIAGQDAAAGAG